jgi:hypothetical protein
MGAAECRRGREAPTNESRSVGRTSKGGRLPSAVKKLLQRAFARRQGGRGTVDGTLQTLFASPVHDTIV